MDRHRLATFRDAHIFRQIYSNENFYRIYHLIKSFFDPGSLRHLMEYRNTLIEHMKEHKALGKKDEKQMIVHDEYYRDKYAECN